MALSSVASTLCTASLVEVTKDPTVPFRRLVAGCDSRLALAQVKRLSG